MPTISETPATKEQSYLRLALWGPSGAGKTFTALKLAEAIGGKVAALDTERSAMRKYADLFQYHPIEGLASNDPRAFAEVIWLAAESGFTTLVLDTISPAWSGPGGATDINDRLAVQKHGGNTFRAWSETNQIIDVLMRALLEAPIHVIATMRARTVYAQEESEEGGRRRTSIHKLGQAPEQRQNVEYEFDIVCSLDNAVLTVTKTRFPEIEGIMVDRPGAAFMEPIMAWLGAGEERPVPEAASGEAIAELVSLLAAEGIEERTMNDVFQRTKGENAGVLPAAWVAEKIEAAKQRAAEKTPGAQEPPSQPEATEAAESPTPAAEEPETPSQELLKDAERRVAEMQAKKDAAPPTAPEGAASESYAEPPEAEPKKKTTRKKAAPKEQEKLDA
jgi:hypothetical protein